MFVLVRAITFAALFIGLVLVYLPGRFVSGTGLVRPATIEWQQIGGIVTATLGGLLALWCVLAFALIGKGTPAPFDPPRTLVIRGPYRFVRNPMYIGATLGLLGAALFYQSWSLALYAGIFVLLTHLFVIAYEEPTLRRSFGTEYDDYRSSVRRWLPRSSGFKG